METAFIYVGLYAEMPYTFQMQFRIVYYLSLPPKKP